MCYGIVLLISETYCLHQIFSFIKCLFLFLVVFPQRDLSLVMSYSVWHLVFEICFCKENHLASSESDTSSRTPGHRGSEGTSEACPPCLEVTADYLTMKPAQLSELSRVAGRIITQRQPFQPVSHSVLPPLQ